MAHLPHVSTLSRPGTRPGIRPVIRDGQRRAGLIASLSRCLSATGVRFLGILFRARELGSPYGRLTGPPEGRPDPDGVSGYRTHEARLGPGAFCTPGTAVSTRPSAILGRRLPHYNGTSLSPRHYHPTRGVPMTRHQQRFTVIHPMPVFSTPVIPGRSGNPWAFPNAQHPTVTSDAPWGRRQASDTDLSYVFGISRASNRHNHSLRATSRRNSGSDLPCRRRSCRPARSTSTTRTPAPAMYRVRPAP